MARINRYSLESTSDISIEDFLLGSDFVTKATKNFPINSIVNFVESAIANRVISREGNFFYTRDGDPNLAPDDNGVIGGIGEPGDIWLDIDSTSSSYLHLFIREAGGWQDEGVSLRGNDGMDGAAAGFGSATATALPAGDAPTVNTSGPDTAKVFEFGIPAGATGAKGDEGDQGDQGIGITSITAPQNPAVGTTQTVTVALTDPSGDTTPANQTFQVPAGATGPQGVQGRYEVDIFFRSATQPGTPVGGAFLEATGELDPNNLPQDPVDQTASGTWSTTVAGTSGTEVLWESRFTFNPSTYNFSPQAVNQVSWSEPFQAGAQGPSGMKGDKGDQGDAGPQGIQGARGSRIFTTDSQLTAGTGNSVADTEFADLSVGDVIIITSGAGIGNVFDVVAITGVPGTVSVPPAQAELNLEGNYRGERGAAGPRGFGIVSGADAPTAAIPANPRNGDFYLQIIDVDNILLFGPRVTPDPPDNETGWGTGTNLVGEDGTSGVITDEDVTVTNSGTTGTASISNGVLSVNFPVGTHANPTEFNDAISGTRFIDNTVSPREVTLSLVGATGYTYVITNVTAPNNYTVSPSGGQSVTITLPASATALSASIAIESTSTFTATSTTQNHRSTTTIGTFLPYFSGSVGTEPTDFTDNSSLTDEGRPSSGLERFSVDGDNFAILSYPTTENPVFNAGGFLFVPDITFVEGVYTQYVFPYTSDLVLTVTL